MFCLTVYTTHWSFHISYLYIIINQTIEIKKIYITFISSLNIENGKNARCYRGMRGAAVIGGIVIFIVPCVPYISLFIVVIF